MSKPLARSNTYSGPQRCGPGETTSTQRQHTTPPLFSDSPPTTAFHSTPDSGSTVSDMSQEPVTPPKVFRPQPRYPSHLSRKKSDEIRTYEPLEDLLRAAGYKETRIFTPEAERIDTPKEAEGVLEKPLATVKDGVAAVAGFLANLIPSAAGADKTATARLAEGLETERPRTSAGVLHAYSPPPSPLARMRPGQQPPRKEATRNTIDLSEPPTPTTTVSSLHSFGDPTPRASRYYAGGGGLMPPSTASSTATNSMPPPPLPHRTSQHLPPRSASYLSAQTSSGQMSKQPSHASLRQQAYANTLEIVSPHPSQAARRLRHMASTQSIEVPPRPSSTPVAHYAHSRRPATTVRVSDTESSEGTEATYVPAPVQHHQHHHHHYPHPHPPTRLSSASHLRPVPARQSVLDTLRQGFPEEANGRLVPPSSPLSKSSASMTTTTTTTRPNFLSTDPYGFQPQHHVYHQSGSAGYGQAPRTQTLRATRSSLSQTSSRAGGSRRSYTQQQQQQQPKIRSGLSDQTNVTTTTTTPNTSTTSLASSGKCSTGAGGSMLIVPLPHPLLVFSAHPERGRAMRCEGEVTKTRVVCRSAPGSRASSIEPGSDRRVFLGGLGGGGAGSGSVGKGRRSTGGGGGGGKRRKGGRGGYGSGKGASENEDGVSSLTLTEQLLEGDVPVGEEIEEEESRRLRRKAKAASRKRYLGGWMLGGSQADDEDSQEEGEEEVTLDTLMVPPPKRQQSIKSLRRHLDGQGLRRPQSVGPAPDRASGFSFRFVGGSSNKEDLEEALFSDDWIRGGGARRRNSEEGDEEEFSTAGWFGHDVDYGRERSSRGKSRLSSALGFRSGS